MNTSRFTFLWLTALSLGIDSARAGDFGISYHEFVGQGWANVFDGGPPVADSEDFAGQIGGLGYFALDLTTTPGVLGASAESIGRSQIFPFPEKDGFVVSVDLATLYLPSLFPGGDNPGGAAEGELFSMIEFIMPAEEIDWSYQLLIDEDPSFFEGSTSVLFENVTQSQTLLTLSEEVLWVKGLLSGNPGDVMRITTQMSGSGTMGPGSFKKYESTLTMRFIVPEPGVFAYFTFSALGLLLSRRCRRGEHAQPISS